MRPNLIHSNRAGCFQMRADDGSNLAGNGASPANAWQSESELAQLQTEVFAVTGVKVSADDPIMAVLVIQKREMKAYIAELTQAQHEQQDIFLAAFKTQVQEVSQAADKLAKQQQHIINTVLKANQEYLQSTESKLFGSVALKIKKQNQDEQQIFLGSLKKVLMLSGCLLLVAHIMLLGLFAVLAK